MSISALDENTVKLLKTSQVITSVAYAVKELVENSLDAAAKNIEVNLYDNGLSQIEVKDDGCGISKEDAPFMALASYTSKIKNFEDLEDLHTYGFRGEALQALSEVADVRIISKTEKEEIATLYSLDSNGNITKSEPCHRPVGTTVQVNGLFKKMPVRRQYLLNSRRANQDLKYLETLLKSFGIIQPFLRITYRRNKQIVFIKSSANSLIESVANVLGKDMTLNLEWIEEQNPEGKIQLMLPKKDLQDPTPIFEPGHQYIFVNNRILVHKELEKLLNKRIQEYFNKGTPNSKKCLFVLNITIEPSNLDINLEPNKTKGFLKNEKEIIESVDKILMTFYQLEESREEKNDNVNETDTINEKNDSVEIDNNNEIEWPACKKRKVNLNGKAYVENIVDFSEITKTNGHSNRSRSPEQEACKIPIIVDVKGPVLSESDSNSGDEMNFHKKRRSVQSKTVSRPMEDLNTPETLSQLPVVDLGEEFSSQIIREKQNQMLKPNDLIARSSKDTESLFSDLDIGDDFNWNENLEESKSILKQSTLSLNTSEKGELLLEVDRNSIPKVLNPPPNSWSRGHVPGLQSGVDVNVLESGSDSGEKELKPNSLTGFNIFFSQTRPELVKENPEMSVPQIARLLSNRWKVLSPEKKAHYREMASERAKNSEMSCKKVKKEKEDADKNKKRFLDMLKGMKSKRNDNKKKNETLKTRTIANMEINIEKVTRKFYRPENIKKNVVIGPVKPSFWIAKVANQYLLIDVAEMYRKLDFTEHNPNETNAATLETLLKRWTAEKEDMSAMHVIDSKI